MSELSFLKINESQIPIDAYKSIMDHYVSFLKYFYGKDIDLVIKEGSQILQAIKKNNQDINNPMANDFNKKLTQNIFDRKTYKEYHTPIDHLYNISCIQERFELQDFNLFFDGKNIIIDKEIHDNLSPYYKKDIKELTSIIGSIHLIADKKEELKIRVTDREDKKEINGIIKTHNKENDIKLFEKIRIDYYGKEVLISGILYRNQITFEKKTIDITKVKKLENNNIPLSDFEGILG